MSDGEGTGTSTLKKLYEITFVDSNGTPLTSEPVKLPAGTSKEDVAGSAPVVEVPAGYTLVWTPVIEAVSSNATYTATYTLGDQFVYPVGNGGVLIDRDWLADYAELANDTQPGSDAYKNALDVLSKPVVGGNIPLWQCYVLGLNPAKKHTLVIDFAADDGTNYSILGEFTPGLEENEVWDSENFRTGTDYATTDYSVNANYRLVYRNAEGKWQYANEQKIPVNVNSTLPEFTVNMADVAFKTLAIIIDVTVDSAQ